MAGSNRRRLYLLGLLVFGAPFVGQAEPYLAVASGQKCVTCHVNPSGGGLRTAFGTAYAQTQIAARSLAEGTAPWTGQVNDWLSLGGDLRGGYDAVDPPGSAESSDFGVSRGTVYLQLRAVPGLLSFYIDQQVAPNRSLNREAFALLTPAGGRYTLKVGKFFLPHGLRLQDDTAFVRQVTGINFDTPDNGVEVGLELGKWSTQLAVSNGTAGGADIDTSKQVSMSTSFVRPRWRVGASYNHNNADLGDREMQSLFAGLQTGPVSWLAEADFITDETSMGQRDIYVSLLEGNWQLRKGHNLKLSYEFLDPNDDIDEDEQERYSLIWEYSPMQFLQSRLGFRAYNGIPDDAASNRNEVFAELHVFF